MSEVSETPRRQVSPLRAGATAMGIVPQTIEDVWKVAKYIVTGKMAPDSLVKGKEPDEAASAVAVVIMSGLELGLAPMVAMRSFGMINGKPGLYGDGLINVCRRSGRAEYITVGYVHGDTDETSFGFCEAKRSDTGEVSREEYSIADAKGAGLWQLDKPFIRKEVWGEVRGQKVWKDDVPNDAVWFKHWKRMLRWRAAGYCLRNLFADVLGGVPTMDELDEVYGEDEPMRDVTSTAQVTRSGPPPVPDEPEPLDVAQFVTDIIAMVSASTTEDELIESWESERVDALLVDHTEALDEVYEARNARLATFQPEADEGGEQQALEFPGDK